MHQNAQKDFLTKMSISKTDRERLEALRAVPAFAEAHESSLELLTKSSEEVSLGQGQTLLRVGAIETHAFLLLEGALGLLAEGLSVEISLL